MRTYFASIAHEVRNKGERPQEKPLISISAAEFENGCLHRVSTIVDFWRMEPPSRARQSPVGDNKIRCEGRQSDGDERSSSFIKEKCGRRVAAPTQEGGLAGRVVSRGGG